MQCSMQLPHRNAHACCWRAAPACLAQSHRPASKLLRSRSVRSCITRAADQQNDEQQQVPSAPQPQATPVPPPSPQQQAAVQQQAQQQTTPQPQPQPQPQPAQQQRPRQQPAQQPQQQRVTAPPMPPQQHQHQDQQQRQQQQRSRQPGWLSGVIHALQRMPSTLTAFLLGGVAACMLLFGWAKGSPMRTNNPYSFTMTFDQASKLEAGTPVRMKGVQIGIIKSVSLFHSHIDALAEVSDQGNIIPQSARVDINLLGLAADPWIDITPPPGCLVRRDHGPHHPECAKDGLIVCHNGRIKGSQGGSTDFMMKFFLSQHDRTRTKNVDVIYHSKKA